MRKIKVRGYSTEKLCADSQWVEGFGVMKTDSVNGKDEYILFSKHGHFVVVGESVGQFTGLRDKSGKEVYEGDIVKIHSDLHYECYEVKFACGGFVAGDFFLDDYWNMYGYMFEVVGNRFDNPELMQLLEVEE